MNVKQLNARLQPLKASWLVQMSRQFGVILTEQQVEQLKKQVDVLAAKGATMEEVKRSLSKTLDEQTVNKLFTILQQFLNVQL